MSVNIEISVRVLFYNEKHQENGICVLSMESHHPAGAVVISMGYRRMNKLYKATSIKESVQRELSQKPTTVGGFDGMWSGTCAFLVERLPAFNLVVPRCTHRTISIVMSHLTV